MITNRRQENDTKELLGRRSALDLLDREETLAKNELFANTNIEKPSVNENHQARMSKNFDILLNYEKYLEKAKKDETLEEENIAQKAEEVISQVETNEAKIEEVKPKSVEKEEDIIPSLTTMQFSKENKENVYEDIKEENKSKAGTKFHLSLQGKVLCAIYAIVVVTIMALIILNTTVLANLKTTYNKKLDNLTDVKSKYSQVEEKYNEISSDKNVIEIAENEYNMIK